MEKLGPSFEDTTVAQQEAVEKVVENINLFADPEIRRVRCKMNVNSLKDVGASVRVELGAVYSSRPDSENKSFSDSTPCAFFSIDISKSAPASKTPWLVPGAQVYVDLQLADVPEWNWSRDRMPDEGKRIEIRVGTLTGESRTGTFVRESDEEFVRVSGNTYGYPKLKLDGEEGTRFNLYSNTHNWMAYYWKYLD